MKISRLEFVLLLLTAACLAFFAGWFLGGQSAPGTVRIAAQHSPPSSQTPPAASPEPEETGPAASEAQPPAPSPSASEAPGLVNINTAGSEELQTLPGIGEKRAEDIIAYREEHGPFRIVEDITDVSGIGEGILSRIIDYITVE